MSDTFENILVKDDKIGCLTNKVKYQVLKGGQNITAQPFKAISATTSAHVYNVTVPSLETIISREVLWSSEITLCITSSATNATNNTAQKPYDMFLINYGVTDALSAFPLHSLVTNMTCTVNNNTVSMNVQDTLPILLRLIEQDELSEYESGTPTCLDYLANYRDGVEPMAYQLDVIGTGMARTLQIFQPNAAEADGVTTPGAGYTNGTKNRSWMSYPNNSLAYDMSRPSASNKKKPRGTWKLLQLYALDNTGAQRPPKVTDLTVYARFKVVEPLLLSPFVFGNPGGKQGFYGIQTMNFQMNMSANASRAWRSVPYLVTAATGTAKDQWFVKTATVSAFNDSKLLFTFMTPHASDMLEPRNVVPYYEMPIYRTSNFSDLAPYLPSGTTNSSFGQPDATGNFIQASGTSQVTLTSSNIQLNCVPDKLIICVRRQIANLTCCDTDSYLTINNISVQWNNQAGILSTFSPEQLYRASVLSGLHNMTWDEFSGTTVCNFPNTATNNVRAPYSGLGSTGLVNTSGAGVGIKLIPTTGSILVLDFATVLQLTEEYYAPGSLGSFNLQLNIGVYNNTGVTWPGSQYELIVMPMNTGVFVNEKGTSSTFIALLTKEDVLQASAQEPYTKFEVKRMVGGGFLDALKSSMGWLSSKLPFIKQGLGAIEHPLAQTGHNVLHALGYGKGRLADRLM